MFTGQGITDSKYAQGFTLVELIAVMVIAGILAVAVSGRLMSNTLFQLESARDLTLTALVQAQQAAMVQSRAVRVLIGPNTVDIRQDADNNGSFSAAESLRLGSTQYPLSLANGVTVTSHTLNFNRRGETTAATITLSKGTAQLNISLSATGFAR